MPLQWLYEASVGGASEDISNRVRLYTADLTQSAEELATAISQITVDDPSGDYDIVAWRRIRVHETLATGSNSLVANLWVGDRTVTRMDPEVSAARKWLVSVVDMNAVPRMRVLTGSNANRPAETDIQRLTWLLSTNEMSRVTVSEFVNPNAPVNMDANDYRGQTCEDVINDCAQDSGKNFFIYTKQTAPSLSLGLYYDTTASTAYTSSIRLSNVATDVDNVLTFFISDDTKLYRDPSRTYSGAYVRYKNGAVYEENTLTSNIYTRRDAVYDASNVNTQAGATRRAQRYLVKSSTEEDRITTAFWCPSEKVNWVREGQRLQIRATHLPGYETFSYQRVLKRAVNQVSEANNSTDPGYLVTLELATTPVPDTCTVTGYNNAGTFGTVFTNTVTGFYPYSSTYGTFGDYVANSTGGNDGRVFYTSSGGGGERVRPRTVTDASTGAAGGWHFSDYGVAKAGMPTGLADGGAAIASPMKLQIMVLGPGTLTVWATSPDAGTWELYRCNLAADPAFDTRTMLSNGSMTYPSTSIVVPDDGSCLHYVLVNDLGTNAGSLYYGGHNWVAG